MAGARPTDDDPIDPVDPEDPEYPIDPEDPVDPADPEDPQDPEDLVDPEDPEDPEDPADPADPEPPRQLSRGAALRERAKTAERDNVELRERLEKLERQQQQPRIDPAAEAERKRREAEEDERIRLSGDPDLIANHAVSKVEKRLSAQFNGVVHHVVDRADKTDFQALCADNPAVKAVAADVEKQLVQSRAQGLNPTREALAKYIIGERVLSRSKGAKSRQEKRAAGERQRQQARPGSRRSDVNSSGRSGKDTQAERARRLDESGQM